MLIFQLVVLFAGALEPSGSRVWLKTEMLGTACLEALAKHHVLVLVYFLGQSYMSCSPHVSPIASFPL